MPAAEDLVEVRDQDGLDAALADWQAHQPTDRVIEFALAAFERLEIADSNPTGRRNYYDVECESSRKQNRRADVYCANDDELRHWHCILVRCV